MKSFSFELTQISKTKGVTVQNNFPFMSVLATVKCPSVDALMGTYLKLFQLISDQSLRFSQRRVTALYTLMNLTHRVRRALAAFCTASEHPALKVTFKQVR